MQVEFARSRERENAAQAENQRMQQSLTNLGKVSDFVFQILTLLLTFCRLVSLNKLSFSMKKDSDFMGSIFSKEFSLMWRIFLKCQF